MSTASFCGIELTWCDFYWSGKYVMGDHIELQVNSKDEQPVTPCTKQELAWLSFIENQAIRSQVLSAIFDYYNEMRPRYEAMGSKWIENMPVISSPKDLECMITLNSITICWPYDASSVQLGLSFSCTWEEEHGLGVVLAGDEVIKVGGADCAII